ncbi:tetraspanin-13a [Mugil cephalus]|uniref:tetraspanin-13a n=1 Tax=Mugil cephalus TaxID=48193 RepID=UPI001FB6C2AE|nr:tetraspanin-13a [Mugil cephalus]
MRTNAEAADQSARRISPGNAAGFPPARTHRHTHKQVDRWIQSVSQSVSQSRRTTQIFFLSGRTAEMVCGGFVCTKNSLCALNILYVLVSLLLVGVAAWGKWFGLVSSIRVVAGVISVGIFLFLVAFVGLCGALKHHQVLLFFYMMILFVVFVLQFAVSCACLSLNADQQKHLLEVGWNKSEATQVDLEKTLNCCSFSNVDYNATCPAVCFHKTPQTCSTCSSIILEYAEQVLHFVGGIGLFFSFTEILGVWLTHRYRNLKDPRSNPGAFL